MWFCYARAVLRFHQLQGNHKHNRANTRKMKQFDPCACTCVYSCVKAHLTIYLRNSTVIWNDMNKNCLLTKVVNLTCDKQHVTNKQISMYFQNNMSTVQNLFSGLFHWLCLVMLQNFGQFPCEAGHQCIPVSCSIRWKWG